jgi:pimeloyl-ACP methyl ester carboxylesterase
VTRAGQPVAGHSDDALAVHERMLAASPARGRQIEVSGRRVEMIETGEGSPVLFLHGSGTSSLSLLPVLDRLQGVRAIAVDRPGFGLSDPVRVTRERFRDHAVEFVDEVVRELALESFALAGNSMGGTWALWYALARREPVRGLVLLGSAPLLPGTRAPAPLRMSTTPVLGDVLPRVMKPNRKMVSRLMSSVGEKDTIARYPDVLDAVVAAGRDPVASAANLAELRAVMTPVGFRGAQRVSSGELTRVSAPTLLIWGDRDPVGSVEVAEEVTHLIPDARLEVLPGGHVPYLGNPDRAAELVSEFAG